MLEIVLITIVVIISFAAIAWYAIKRSQKRNHDFLFDLAQRMEPEHSGGDAFNSILETELGEQEIDLTSTPDIESEPFVSLSDDAKSIAPPSQPKKEAEPKPEKPVQTKINLSIDDDLDLDNEPKMDLASPKEPTSNTKNSQPQEAEASSEMVIAFTVMALQGEHFLGRDLKSVLDSLNFVYGEMGIYHKLNSGVHKEPLFSIANILEPGTFNPTNIASMATPGILIFATLPGPINGLTLFDELYETSQTIARELDGILSDDKRQPVDSGTLEQIRNRIFKLNLTLQTETNNNRNDNTY